VKKLFEFFCERGGHVTSAAILDFRIFSEKSEEKQGYKKICELSKLFFQLKSMDKQVSDTKQPLFYLYRHLLLKNLQKNH
jgi:hypothetical protein